MNYKIYQELINLETINIIMKFKSFIILFLTLIVIIGYSNNNLQSSEKSTSNIDNSLEVDTNTINKDDTISDPRATKKLDKSGSVKKTVNKVPKLLKSNSVGSNTIDEYGVDELLKIDPNLLLNKPIFIKGVVSKIIPEKSLCYLIDIKEYQACQTYNCAENLLPAKYKNNSFKLGDKVKLYGKIQKINNKYLYEISSSEILK